jgi:hypothetical protein
MFVKAPALLATTCGAEPVGATTPWPARGVVIPATERATIASGAQSKSERKSKWDEGGTKFLAKGKEDSSNLTWWEIIILLVARSRQWYLLCSRVTFAPKNTQMGDTKMNAKQGKMWTDERKCIFGKQIK